VLAVVDGGGSRPWDGDPRWKPFRVSGPDEGPAAGRGGARGSAIAPPRRGPGEAGWWLRGAALVLALLAVAAAAVSWQAQYVMVLAVKHARAVAAVEAGIPDAGAVIFASLGVALALHGKRALRPRVLNAACIGISLAMNALAAAHGWRGLAIWVMPAAIYALASDTLISVVRARVLARQKDDGTVLGDDSPDLLAAIGGTGLWLLRLLLAGPSTLRGFRSWVTEECPVAPGRKAAPAPAAAAIPSGPAAKALPALARAPSRSRPRRARDGEPTKRDRLIALAGERHDLASVPLGQVSRLATAIAQEIGYSPGTARRELVRHVRELQSATATSMPAEQAQEVHHDD
jgi:hypothetical protein